MFVLMCGTMFTSCENTTKSTEQVDSVKVDTAVVDTIDSMLVDTLNIDTLDV